MLTVYLVLPPPVFSHHLPYHQRLDKGASQRLLRELRSITPDGVAEVVFLNLPLHRLGETGAAEVLPGVVGFVQCPKAAADLPDRIAAAIQSFLEANTLGKGALLLISDESHACRYLEGKRLPGGPAQIALAFR